MDVAKHLKIPFAGFLEFRPFRTSALLLAGMMVLLLMFIVNTIFNLPTFAGPAGESVIPDAINNLWAGLGLGVIIGAAFQALGAGVVKLCDDGGESDTVKIARLHFQYVEKRDERMFQWLEKQATGLHLPRDDA